MYLLLLSAVLPAAGFAETMTCTVAQAYRLSVGGLVSHPQGSAGYPEAAKLSVDTDTQILSTAVGPIAEAKLLSAFDPVTGADVVFAAPDGSLFFRARRVDDSISYVLLDTYDLYVGQCVEE
jgi:hypothetical protein